MINRIVFAAGGTGGHIYPAIAIADELKKLNDKIEIRFIGAKGRIEEKIVPKNGYKLETIEVTGFKRSFTLKNFAAAYKIIRALKEARNILKEFKPEIVFGTGGFVSGPVLKAAGKLGIPAVIEEGNFYPGVTVKLLSAKADKVIVNFEGTKKFLKRQDNIVVMSYPVRENLKRYFKKQAIEHFGLSEGGKVLFVFGGSQGANSINSALLKCCENITKTGVQIIWQTGEQDFQKVSDAVSANNNIKVFRYIDNIDFGYSACDLVLCRGGVSTIMELASFGSAAIFVPYPLASENHQEKNAKALVDKNASAMILDKELNEKLERSVLDIIHDDTKLNAMSENIKQFADSKAASKIAQMLIQMVDKRKN